MAKLPPDTFLIHWERKRRAHVLAGRRWTGHVIDKGADCPCEPEVIVPKKQPLNRFYLHDETLGRV